MASYLLPSSIQKRLLRYALSRIEFLDTEFLDLEHLDISWGTKSTLEFRDVPLQLKARAAPTLSLVQLPVTLELTKARILLLRITIPVDVYSSPIVIEIDGVEARLVGVPNVNPKARTDLERKRKRSHRRQGSLHSGPGEDTNAGLPTAADLATSFLQTEPEEEKAELQAAISSQSQILAASVAASDDGEDDLAVGTGTSLALPAFMTNFLKGIVDRLQVKVHGITVDLDVALPIDSSSPSQTVSPPDLVTIQVGIDDVDIEGVTFDTESLSSASTSRTTQKPVSKHGKRLVSLRNLRGMLITDTHLFTNVTRSSAPSSPSATHSNLSEARSRQWSSKTRSHLNSSQSDSEPGASVRDEVDSASPVQDDFAPRLRDSIANTNPLANSTITSNDGRFEDAPEDEVYEHKQHKSFVDFPDDLESSSIDGSALLDQITDSHLIGDSHFEGQRPWSDAFENKTLLNIEQKSPLSTPRASIFLPPPLDEDQSHNSSHDSEQAVNHDVALRSTTLPMRPHSRFAENRVSRSQPFLPPGRASPAAFIQTSSASVDHRNHPINEDDSDPPTPSFTTPSPDDLAQSMIFSHSDAESMYMSAMSHGDIHAKIPGSWDTSSHSDSEPPTTPKLAERFPSSQHPADNLENAIHTISADPESKSISQSADSHTFPVDSQSSSSETSGKLPASTSGRLPAESPSAPRLASGNSSEHTHRTDEYLRMAKQLFSIDHAALYLPPSSPLFKDEGTLLRDAQSLDGQADIPHSVSPDVPGAFSASSARPSRVKQPQSDIPEGSSDPESKDQPGSFEFDVGQVLVQFDVSIGRLLARITNSISDLFGSDVTNVASTGQTSTAAPQSFQIRSEEISINFLERLVGNVVASNTEATNLPLIKIPFDDVLLRTTLRGLNIDVDVSHTLTKAALTLQKFVLGYAKENIVSFDADLRMRSSVRDLAATAGVDLSMNITRTSQSTRIKISTLPVHVSIDLQKLDDAFSWFGGLSSVLNMGSSMASNANMAPTSPVKSPPKPRGVRFETPIRPDDTSLSSQNKVDARLGGLVLDLIGRNCSIGMDTSAVKLVSREEGIGIAVDKVKISGPHLDQSNQDPAILVEITSARIEYLNTPKDIDLDRLLSLITPSKATYDRDDDILLDTLLRQRRQGAVIRFTVDHFKTQVGKLQELTYLPELGEELSRLSTVTKYLPEDDRPGLLSLVLVRDVNLHVEVNQSLGSLHLRAQNLEAAQITLPALLAVSVSSVDLHRNGTEELVSVATKPELHDAKNPSSAIMARLIGDEMEPVVKVKFWNLKIEYRVPTLMALLGLNGTVTPEEMASSMAASVATLTNRARPDLTSTRPDIRGKEKESKSSERPMMVDIVLRDCVIGLNPLGLPSKVLMVMTEAHVSAILPKDNNASATAELSKGSILVIDDVSNITSERIDSRLKRRSFDGGSSQVADLCSTGFVSVSYISSAKAVVQIFGSKETDENHVDIELRDDLFVLESCADSTQTLLAVLNGLKPPTPPSTDIKYRTKVIPVDDLLASLSGDAFGTAEGNYDFDEDFGADLHNLEEEFHDEENLELNIDSQYYQEQDIAGSYQDEDDKSRKGSILFDQFITHDTNDGVLLESFTGAKAKAPEVLEELDFQEDHFGNDSIVEGTAHRWNSAKNTYDRSNERRIRESPLKVCVRDVHIIWNLFDGYDWQNTRDAITKAVHDVESKAIQKRATSERRSTFDQDIEDDETVIGDCLFNSIYISIPANRDPRDLALDINQELNDNATETESIATTTRSASPTLQGGVPRLRPKRLRLHRSRHHKITFELKGVSLDLVAFPPGSGETQSSVDIRVHDFDIFDHIPTSTWKKFATYMHDAGERESGSSQIHIEILNVKPMPDLAASEIVLKATVLPLRLHVDQDALDFITRFFEFKDNTDPIIATPGDAPFLQRVEVNSVQVKLDFKPKRVDYAGLRSGHTTEFMNFIVLDEADMVLRHTIIYGISGFDKLGKCLNDIWMPDIKRNQLPGILAGLAPVRSLANVGGGVRDLVMVPIAEYKKDGRVVRSLRKGATTFGRTTGIELMKLGAKVAVGTQTVLQGAEDMLVKPRGAEDAFWEDVNAEEEEEKKQISLYADQPVGVWQGVKGGYAGLARDLMLTRDAIIAIPGEVMESGTARGAATAIGKGLPTIILTPVKGIAEAVGKTLMGATNSLDPQNRRKMDEKYKSGPGRR
ncbi:MAG: autophagy- protein 2 [Claussenomyces sp. TS43310]|nr:MAG: autophagy- protein 2 [Claussenomyces sp. TS43310]